jgi:hypothetical protein
VLLKSSPKKGTRFDDIPPSLRMSGQFYTNRDLNCTIYRRPSTPLRMQPWRLGFDHDTSSGGVELGRSRLPSDTAQPLPAGCSLKSAGLLPVRTA